VIKLLRFFVLIFAVFLPAFIFFVPQWHSRAGLFKFVDVFDLYTPKTRTFSVRLAVTTNTMETVLR